MGLHTVEPARRNDRHGQAPQVLIVRCRPAERPTRCTAQIGAERLGLVAERPLALGPFC